MLHAEDLPVRAVLLQGGTVSPAKHIPLRRTNPMLPARDRMCPPSVRLPSRHVDVMGAWEARHASLRLPCPRASRCIRRTPPQTRPASHTALRSAHACAARCGMAGRNLLAAKRMHACAADASGGAAGCRPTQGAAPWALRRLRGTPIRAARPPARAGSRGCRRERARNRGGCW